MFVIEIPYLNLDQIYKSGQCFRWIKLKDGKYVIPCGNTALKVEQQKERLIMSCTDEEFYNKWYKYFDVGTDYYKINSKARLSESEYIKECALKSKGIRILQQDLFEVIITFMLSAANNMPRIRNMVNHISEKCGTKRVQSMREAGKVTWYEFPSHSDILTNQNKLDMNFGLQRIENVLQLCEDIQAGWFDLDLLQEMEYDTAKQYLMEFDGIGAKIADCICLYGLHMLNVFPVDTHIKQIFEREFDSDLDGVLNNEMKDMKNHAGIIQQYMFYTETCEEEVPWD